MKNKDQIPDAAEFGQLRAYLARQGVSQQWIKNVLDLEYRTRGENAARLKLAMRSLT